MLLDGNGLEPCDDCGQALKWDGEHRKCQCRDREVKLRRAEMRQRQRLGGDGNIEQPPESCDSRGMIDPKKGLRVDVHDRTFVLLDAVEGAAEPQWYGADVGTYPHSAGVHALKVADMRVRQVMENGEASVKLEDAHAEEIPQPQTAPPEHA